MAGLADFVKEIIQIGFTGSGMDGGQIQDLAVEHGLLVETTFDPERHEDFEGYAEKGDQWFEYSDLLKNAK